MTRLPRSAAIDPEAICYLVPFYSESDSQHFAHLPHLLREVGKRCRLFVVVERGGADPGIPNAVVQVQRTPPTRRIRRYIEFARIASQMRRAGCGKFFIRISKGAALTLIALRPVLGAEVFYWQSGAVLDAPQRGQSRSARLRDRLAESTTKFIVRRADAFVTGPESMVEYYERWYGVSPDDCVVLYNDLDMSRFTPDYDTEQLVGAAPKQLTAIFVGRLSYLKGGDRLVPIAALLKPECPELRVLALGSVSTELIDPGGVPTNLEILGPKSNGEVLQRLRAADLFLLPSRAEGFPRALLEAMACGKAAVAFSVGGVMDIVGPLQAEFMVNPGDIDAFAAKVKELINDPEKRRLVSEENLRYAQRFDTPLVADMFVRNIVQR